MPEANAASGQTAIAVTETNANAPVIIAFEVSGLVTASVLDVSHSATGTATSWSSGSTTTTTQATELWLGAACVVNTAPTGPASPWTNISQASSTTDGIAGSQIVSSTGAASYAGTGGGSNGWASVVVALKGASGTAVSLTTAAVDVTANTLGAVAGPVALPVVQVLVCSATWTRAATRCRLVPR